MVTDDLCGCTGRAAISPDPRFEVKELGEIDMVSRALATLDLVTRDDAQPAFPPVRLLPPSIDHELLESPGTGTEYWLQPRSASCSADQ